MTPKREPTRKSSVNAEMIRVPLLVPPAVWLHAERASHG
jgi:hypothetical protein